MQKTKITLIGINVYGDCQSRNKSRILKGVWVLNCLKYPYMETVKSPVVIYNCPALKIYFHFISY
jgi:hypothetical protein